MKNRRNGTLVIQTDNDKEKEKKKQAIQNETNGGCETRIKYIRLN